MSAQPGSVFHGAASPVHLPEFDAPATPPPPPLPPQQSSPPTATFVGKRAPARVVNDDRSPYSVFCFLPIALSCSPASVERDFFMYSRNAGIATAARMP